MNNLCYVMFFGIITKEISCEHAQPKVGPICDILVLNE